MPRKVDAASRIAELGIELSYDGSHSYMGDPYLREMGPFVAVAYLVHDDNCEDPLTNCDAMGRIVMDKSNVMDALGRTSKSYPMMDDEVALILRLRGIEDANDEVNRAAQALWLDKAELRAVGVTYSVPLRKLYHGGYDELDVENGFKADAAWIPDEHLYKHLEAFEDGDRRRAEAYLCFEQALEEYNKWAEGQCYGLIVEVFRKETQKKVKRLCDDVWGFIGDDYAEEELKQQLKDAVQRMEEAWKLELRSRSSERSRTGSIRSRGKPSRKRPATPTPAC